MRHAFDASKSSPIICESLESRRMLAVTLTGGALKIIGGAVDDSIAVSLTADKTKFVVAMNGHNSRFAASAVKSISIDGRAGNDTIRINDGGKALPASTALNGGAGNDSITGGARAEKISGGDGDDSIGGGGGIDQITGGANNDIVSGGAGDDIIFGGEGDDKLTGDAGNDIMYGDAGNDTIEGGAGSDILGGDDDDSLIPVNTTAPANVVGDDVLDGGADSDWLLGGTSNTQIADSNGKDTMTGGAGVDIIDARGGDDNVADLTQEDFVPAIDFPPFSKVTHTHAFLHIQVKDSKGVVQDALVPASIGFFPQGLSGLHTHGDVNGKIHFESPNANDTYKLQMFFIVWGISFDARHVGRLIAPPGKKLIMTVNGKANNQYGSYSPHDLDQIVIRLP